jgi:glycosyltransferase involved in cell wall biosynthesis
LKVSIITINYNSYLGLKKTIESVIIQSYGNTEYIIIDGASTDGSKELIESYGDKITIWVSEPDNGIYSAMNKGILKATGDYCLFINSGDYLASETVLAELVRSMDGGADIISSNCLINSETGSFKVIPPYEISFYHFYKGEGLPHPSTLIKRTLFDKIGLYNETNKIISDWEFFLIALCLYGASYKYVPVDLSVFKTDGISSQNGSLNLINSERKSLMANKFNRFLKDYQLLDELKKNSQSKHENFYKRVKRYFLR